MLFTKIINYVGLLLTIVAGIVIPITGLTAGSFCAICFGLFIIFSGFDSFNEIQKRIEKEEEKDKKEQLND